MTRKNATRWMTGLLVALAMVFGARAALAAPAVPVTAGPGCDHQKCDYYCITTGGANYGVCMNGVCVCRSGP